MDVLYKFILECRYGVIILLFAGKHFADSVEDLDEEYLIVADATAHLVECAENPQDIVLARTMTFHVLKLIDDRQLALADE